MHCVWKFVCVCPTSETRDAAAAAIDKSVQAFVQNLSDPSNQDLTDTFIDACANDQYILQFIDGLAIENFINFMRPLGHLSPDQYCPCLVN